MKHKQLIILTRTAVLAALIAIATMVIPIPIPGGGYANAGDIVILITAFVLGPVPAAFAAGFGSVVADLLLGYSAYAPGTLLVKGLAGLTAGLVFLALERRSGSFLSMLTAGIAGEAVMVAGYYVFEALILQSALAAAAGVVPNILQGTAGIAGAPVLMPALRKALRFRSATKS